MSADQTQAGRYASEHHQSGATLSEEELFITTQLRIILQDQFIVDFTACVSVQIKTGFFLSFLLLKKKRSHVFKPLYRTFKKNLRAL